MRGAIEVTKRSILFAWLIFLLLPAAHGQSSQDIQTQLDPARRSARASAPAPALQAELSERQAVARARSKFSGKILRISVVGAGSNRRYQLRMEKDGKVFTVFVHARTGQVARGG